MNRVSFFETQETVNTINIHVNGMSENLKWACDFEVCLRELNSDNRIHVYGMLYIAKANRRQKIWTKFVVSRFACASQTLTWSVVNIQLIYQNQIKGCTVVWVLRQISAWIWRRKDETVRKLLSKHIIILRLIFISSVLVYSLNGKLPLCLPRSDCYSPLRQQHIYM